jgi:hypothetical protein
VALVFSALLALTLLAGGPHLATTPWNVSNITPELGTVLEDSLAAGLRAHGLDVVTRQDIASILGQERQKQLLGCSDDGSSCLAELANALGCEATVVVSVARLGSDFRGTARVLSANDGHVMAEALLRADSETRLVDSLDDVAASLAKSLVPRARTASSGSSPHWVPAVVGGALVVGSAVLFGLAGDRYAAVVAGDASAAGAGKTYQALAWVGAGVGVAALLGALLWWRLDLPVTLAPSVGVESKSLTVSGVW